MTAAILPSDDLKYVQVSQDYTSDDGLVRLKKGEVLMFLQRKTGYWAACTKDGGNNNISDPFCVPTSILLDFEKLDVVVAGGEEDDDSPDYINIISDLDDFLNNECVEAEEEDEDDSDDYVNDMMPPPPQIMQPPPVIKERRANKNYLEEHMQQEMQRLALQNATVETPEPDYDHEYVNVDEARPAADYTDTENETSQLNNVYEEEIVNEIDDPDISKEYSLNKQVLKEEPTPLLRVSAGWTCAKDQYDRVYYFHENDKEKQKWFLAYDSVGKHYFYNSSGESKWELPEISKSQDRKTKQLNEDLFDSSLPAFNQLAKNLVKNPSDSAAHCQLDSLKEQNLKQQAEIKYTYKPTEMLQNNFKILRLKDGGKDVKKKTTESHLIHLASSKLLFVRQKHNRLEYYLDFKGGKCIKFENKKLQKLADGVKKKSAFMVETLDGNQVLFIHDDENVIDKWVLAINSIIQQIQSEFSPIYERPDALHAVNVAQDKHFNPTISNNKKESSSSINNESDGDDASYMNSKNITNCEIITDDDSNNNYDNKEVVVMSPAAQQKRKLYPNVEYVAKFTQPPPADDAASATKKPLDRKKSLPEAEVKIEKKLSTAGNSNKFKHITDHLISFFTKRPSAEQLKQRGILQECVFSSNLINLCKKENRFVPEFIVELIRAIENRGVDADGLYRVNGNLSDVQKLRVLINQGKHKFDDFDIHVLSGTLKTFFRELEDPLIPLRMQDRFLQALRLRDKHGRVHAIREVINDMPIAHYQTLKSLCRHLLNVISQSSKNRMHLQNMALVFGPTLLRLNPVNPLNNSLNDNINAQNELIQFILYYYEDLYSNSGQQSSSSIGGGATGGSISNSDLSRISGTIATSVTTVLTNFK